LERTWTQSSTSSLRTTADGWTPDRAALLRRLWADGLSCSQIARRVGSGISRCAVASKARRLSLPMRSPGRSVRHPKKRARPPRESWRHHRRRSRGATPPAETDLVGAVCKAPCLVAFAGARCLRAAPLTNGGGRSVAGRQRAEVRSRAQQGVRRMVQGAEFADAIGAAYPAVPRGDDKHEQNMAYLGPGGTSSGCRQSPISPQLTLILGIGCPAVYVDRVANLLIRMSAGTMPGVLIASCPLSSKCCPQSVYAWSATP
jgi:hypothetical protein